MNTDQKLKLSAIRMKFFAAVLLFGLWTALVFLKGIDPQELIFAIGSALVGLGVYHTATSQGAPASSVADLVAGIQTSIDPEMTASAPQSTSVVVPSQPAGVASVASTAATQPAPAQTIQ